MHNVTTVGDLFSVTSDWDVTERADKVERTDVCQEFSVLNSDVVIYMHGRIIPKVELSAMEVTMGSAVLKSCLKNINVITDKGKLQDSGPLALVVPAMKFLRNDRMQSEALFFEALTGLNYEIFSKYFTVIIEKVLSPDKVRVMT